MAEKSDTLKMNDAQDSGVKVLEPVGKNPSLQDMLDSAFNGIFGDLLNKTPVAAPEQKMEETVSSPMMKGSSVTYPLYEVTDQPGLVPLKIWDLKTVFFVGVAVYFLLK